jgi:hypothetical protein
MSADPHDYPEYPFEGLSSGGIMFLDSELHSEAVTLISFLEEKERLIRQGIESKQLEYDGNTLNTKPGASEEIVEGLVSLNTRIEFLAQAKDILSRLSKFPISEPQDQTEIDRLKSKLEKAVDEFQKI